MPGDVTHPDFIKGAVCDQGARENTLRRRHFPLCVPTTQLFSLQPSGQDPAEVGTLLTGLGTALT